MDDFGVHNAQFAKVNGYALAFFYNRHVLTKTSIRDFYLNPSAKGAIRPNVRIYRYLKLYFKTSIVITMPFNFR